MDVKKAIYGAAVPYMASKCSRIWRDHTICDIKYIPIWLGATRYGINGIYVAPVAGIYTDCHIWQSAQKSDIITICSNNSIKYKYCSLHYNHKR